MTEISGHKKSKYLHVSNFETFWLGFSQSFLFFLRQYADSPERRGCMHFGCMEDRLSVKGFSCSITLIIVKFYEIVITRQKFDACNYAQIRRNLSFFLSKFITQKLTQSETFKIWFWTKTSFKRNANTKSASKLALIQKLPKTRIFQKYANSKTAIEGSEK